MWRTANLDGTSFPQNAVVNKSLKRYFGILQGKRISKFLIAKRLAAEWSETDSLASLWIEHARCQERFHSLEQDIDSGEPLSEIPVSERSYLDLKIKIAKEILRECHLCTRKCGVNRNRGSTGYCGCGGAMRISSIFPHMGEEPELVPSGTIFTMGCTVRCRHCQNWGISQWKEEGTTLHPQEIAKEIAALRVNGCRNVNLVGGEPTPWLKNWLETFKYVAVNVPVVWNSNSYYSLETAKLLAGFVDVYLLDFKYGPGECSARISDAPGYWDVCTRNHLEAKKHGELIVRVLVLPDHLDCCSAPVFDWIGKNLGAETRLNLMFQYRPEWRAHEIPELRRVLTKEEKMKAVTLAKKAGLVNFMA